MPKITSAKIGPMPRPMPQGMLDPLPTVTATFDDGSSQEIFSFHPDEIQFAEEELIGLTLQEAHALKQSKDKAFLQS